MRKTELGQCYQDPTVPGVHHTRRAGTGRARPAGLPGDARQCRVGRALPSTIGQCTDDDTKSKQGHQHPQPWCIDDTNNMVFAGTCRRACELARVLPTRKPVRRPGLPNVGLAGSFRQNAHIEIHSPGGRACYWARPGPSQVGTLKALCEKTQSHLCCNEYLLPNGLRRRNCSNIVDVCRG
jgi:hypothetical protein